MTRVLSMTLENMKVIMIFDHKVHMSRTNTRATHLIRLKSTLQYLIEHGREGHTVLTFSPHYIILDAGCSGRCFSNVSCQSAKCLQLLT